MELKKLIESGEGRKLEFKVLFTSPSKIAQTSVAFANGAGGKIIFGVADGGSIVGLESSTVSKLTDQLSNLIYETCSPLIMNEVSINYIDDKVILVVEIFPGADKPYYLKQEGKAKGVYFRAGASTRKANMDVIYDLERRKRNISYDEEIAYEFSVDDLDLTTLKNDFKKITGKELTEEALYNLNILKEEHGTIYPTIGGVLLAGKKPFSDYCGVKCARFKGVTVDIFIDKKEFSGPLYKVVDDVVNFTKNHIPLYCEIHGLQRIETYEVPMLAIREAVLNAIVHRDYTITGSDIKIAIFDDVVEITSPGSLPNTLDIQDILGGRSEVRNKVVARFFEQLGFIEKWGTGIKKIVTQCAEYNLPVPEFKESGSFFQTIIFRKSKKNDYVVVAPEPPVHKLAESHGVYGMNKNVFLLKNIDQWFGIEYSFKPKKQARLVEMVSSLYLNGEILFPEGVSKRTIEYDLKTLKELGIIVFVGARKNGHYQLTNKTIDILNKLS